MNSWAVILDIAMLMGVAMALGLAFERLRQSALLGYLLAGALLGPNALHWVRSEAVVEILAEMGVALLLFSLGLEFSIGRLRRIGAVALGGGTMQLALTAAAGFVVSLLLGFGAREAAALGLIIAPSSTACVLRVLQDRSAIESIHGRAVTGVLLLQDAALVPLVLGVQLLAGGGTFLESLLGLLAVAGATIGLVLVFILLSRYVAPRLLEAAAMTRNRELLTLLAATSFFGAAWLAHALNISPAIGAFVAGVALAGSPFASQARSDVSALKALFVALFFASIGMLADPRWLPQHAFAATTLVIGLVIGKALIAAGAVWIFQRSARNALAAGIALAQVGEFSFVLAAIAVEGGALGENAFRLMLLSTVATLFLTPPLTSNAPRLSDSILAVLERLRLRGPEPHGDSLNEEELSGHVVIVGFGPAGRGVYEALQQSGAPVLILEMNPKTVREARANGIHARIGDGTRRVIQEHARVDRARALVVTAPDPAATAQIIRQARAIAPKLPIIARARMQRHTGLLREAGATLVADEEHEIGVDLGVHVRRLIG